MSFNKTAKKIFASFLTFVMLASFFLPVSVISASAEEITVTADGINVARGTAELIIYTSEFGESTDTNEYGYEVVVDENNVVTTVGGADNSIPEGGFVLSGHNTDEDEKMGEYLKENVQVGDYVYYNKNTLVVTISDEEVEHSSFYSVSTDINGVNITRLENFLVIFNKTGTKTETNDWGYEVVCKAGAVVSLGENNNLIPSEEGSFVVSAHGEKVEWIKENVKLGMSVSYDESKKTVTFKYDEKSAEICMQLKIEEIEADLKEAKENYRYIDFKTVQTKFEEAKSGFENAKDAYENGGKIEEFDSACSKTEKSLEEIKKLLFESRTVEYRGVWIRPYQKTAEEVDKCVEDLYESGINIICIETLFNCTTIMPMPEDNLFEHNPLFRGFDVLKAYIDSCHKRNMELHIWLPTFYVGHKNSDNITLGVGSKKPEWLAISNQGENYAPSDTEYYQMINPANKEAKEFLLKSYRYILENYDIDGWQLDYIRYYRRDKDCDFGYDDITLDAFEAEYGVRPEYDEKASYWKDWVDFRTKYITDMVVSVRELIDEVKPTVLLGADVGPDIENAYNYLYQDYMTWINKGYIDILFPMSYGFGFEEQIKKQVEHCGNSVLTAVGLGIFMPELSPEDVTGQAKTNNVIGADGSSYFEADSFLKKRTGKVLTSSIYRNRAVTPTFDKNAALVETLEYMNGRIDDVIVPLEGMTEAEAENVKKAVDAVIKAVNDKISVKDAIVSAETAVNALENENAKKVLLNDLSYSEKISIISERIETKVENYNENKDNSVAASDDSISEDTADENNWVLPTVIIAAVILIAIIAFISLRKKKED